LSLSFSFLKQYFVEVAVEEGAVDLGSGLDCSGASCWTAWAVVGGVDLAAVGSAAVDLVEVAAGSADLVAGAQVVAGRSAAI